MFQITTLSDSSVRVPPPSLSKPTLEAVTEELENSYVDRVVEDVGLVVTLYEIHSVEGGDVYPGDGGAHFAVTFSVVVFCPFEGEVLVGKLKSCDEHGLKISLGFFDDVHVPESSLQEPSVFDDSERLWVWQYNDIEAYMELDDAVRFRVTGVRFPKPPKSAEEVRHLLPSEGGTPAGKFAPMVVMGTIQSEALGCVTWWNEGDAPEDDAPADAEG